MCSSHGRKPVEEMPPTHLSSLFLSPIGAIVRCPSGSVAPTGLQKQKKEQGVWRLLSTGLRPWLEHSNRAYGTLFAFIAKSGRSKPCLL
jgi:hypothetical protein